MEKQVLVTYATKYGGTGEIADKIGDAKETPALINWDQFRNHILPTHNGYTSPESVPGVQYKEDGHG